MIPLTRFGLGSRRLAGLAVQEQAVDSGAILGIDEIEYGLDPHRLARLIGYARAQADYGHAQYIFTSHSTFAIATLQARDISVVRSRSGRTTIESVPSELDSAQGTIRSNAQALLGARVIVGEGATEVGFIRRLLELWDNAVTDPAAPTSLTQGAVVADGSGGAHAISRALVFRSLGYETMLVLDKDDNSLEAKLRACAQEGVLITQCSPGLSLEQDICYSIPLEGLDEIIESAIDLKSEQHVRRTLELFREMDDVELASPRTWITADFSESMVRELVGRAASYSDSRKGHSGWFKRQEGGEKLADICWGYSDRISETGLSHYVNSFQEFAFGEHRDE
jgi:hypothetical protein